MKKLIALVSLISMLIGFMPATSIAAKQVSAISRPTTTQEQVGYDVSYPQCGKTLPTSQYFGIVGVNGGLASNANNCLADQLVWANQSKVGSNQPKVQLYVNTANPGQIISQVTTWPTTAYDLNYNLPANPYGNGCAGQNDQACSWLYGWNRSIYTENIFISAASSKGININAGDYVWWLDVETSNTWQTGGTLALQNNTASLEGFGAYYKSKYAVIGLYSTASQWGTITGNIISTASNLNGLPNWRPSGSSLRNAITNCSATPLTSGGYIALTQYVVKGLDNDHSCI